MNHATAILSQLAELRVLLRAIYMMAGDIEDTYSVDTMRGVIDMANDKLQGAMDVAKNVSSSS